MKNLLISFVTGLTIFVIIYGIVIAMQKYEILFLIVAGLIGLGGIAIGYMVAWGFDWIE